MFKNFYYGKESLSKSFWFYFIIMNAIVMVAVLSGAKLLHEPQNFYDKPPAYIGIISLLIIFSYRVFSIIGTWRCASNNIKTNSGWATAVYVILVLGIMDLIFRGGVIIYYLLS